MLISTDELEKLDNEKILLIDTRSFKEYSDGHIPSAVNLDLYSFHWIDTTKEGLNSFNEQMKKIFSMAGVTNEKKVIFYDNTSGMLAARGVWLLQYFSHADVSMVDGGFQKWKNENKKIEKKLNGFKPSEFSGKINENLLVGFEYIVRNSKKLTLIDARSKEEYSGSLTRAARSGHIPDSINVDWNLNLNNDGTMKNNEELKKLYTIPKDSEIVTYCQGAYRAANSFLALKKLGFQNVKVYLGSWGEWGNRLELPVD